MAARAAFALAMSAGALPVVGALPVESKMAASVGGRAARKASSDDFAVPLMQHALTQT